MVRVSSKADPDSNIGTPLNTTEPSEGTGARSFLEEVKKREAEKELQKMKKLQRVWQSETTVDLTDLTPEALEKAKRCGISKYVINTY